MRNIVLCAVAAALLAMVLPTTGTPPAAAHATLIATAPPAGATVAQTPRRVSATFDEDLEPTFAALTVVSNDGSTWSSDEVKTTGPHLSVGLKSDVPPGSYTADYRLIAADGHVVTGSWRFDVSGPGPVS